MTERDFVYWLQGYFEICDTDKLTENQVVIIKNHLNLVFHHTIDNQYKEPEKAQRIHDEGRFNSDRRIKC
jgi:hypothetical protein